MLWTFFHGDSENVDDFGIFGIYDCSFNFYPPMGGSVAEWLACWTHLSAEGPGLKSQPRRCRVTVLGKLFTLIVPLFTKQQNQ